MLNLCNLYDCFKQNSDVLILLLLLSLLCGNDCDCKKYGCKDNHGCLGC